MNIDITPIIEAVIALLATVITAFVIPWVKTRTKATQYEIIKSVASVAVMAVEQIYINADGAGKLKYAKEYCETKLSEMGLSVDTEVIEAAVLEMNTKIKETIVELPYELTDDGK